ncbi:MAG: pilin [Patescibacteria group bacterium]|nr:pilin [Patescibacteria group bacterium]
MKLNYKKIVPILSLFTIISLFGLYSFTAIAADPTDTWKEQKIPVTGPEMSTDAPKNMVTIALNWFYIIAAVLCVAVIIWAGITYATAGGDEEKVGKAKNRLIYGIIGVALIIGAYAITQLIKSAMSGTAPAAPTL